SVPDVIQASELVISSFGNMGEIEVGSPIVNIIPRTGGNTFSGTFYADGANGAMSGDNTKALVEGGLLRAPHELIRRPNRAGPALVLRQRQASDGRFVRHQHLGQQERRQPQCLDVRTGSES